MSGRLAMLLFGRGPAAATLVVGILALAVGLLATLREDHYDDAFITYVFARNLAAGHGMVWTPGGPVFWGPTSLVYTLLLAGAARCGLALPATSAVLGALSWAAASATLVPILWRAAPRVAIGAGLLCAFSLLPVHLSPGMESGLFTAIVLAAIALQQAGRPRTAAVVAAIAVFVRPEAVLLLALLGAAALATGDDTSRPSLSRRCLAAARAMAPGLTVLALGLAAAQATLGTTFPESIRAKLAYGCYISGCFSPPGFGRLLAQHTSLPYAIFVGVAAAGGLAVLLVRRQQGRFLFLWLLLQGAAFTVGHAPDSPWYYAPLVPLLFAALASLATLRAGLLPLCVAFVWTASASVAHIREDPFGSHTVWNQEKRQLAGELAVQARDRGIAEPSILAFEVGFLGWVFDGRVDDLLGLVTPGFQPCLRGDDADRMLAARHPDFVVIVEDPGYRATGCVTASSRLRSDYEVSHALVRPSGERYLIWRRHRDV
jgi:hypothetical protein